MTTGRHAAAGRGIKVVALGGGHGLAATLAALRHVSPDVTAVVTVADDGGSSGRLREELDVLPPGDLRMAVSALCESSEWGQTWRDVLQHRFQTEGDLNGHAVGNLLLVAIWQLLGDEVAGLDLIGRLLGAHGRVLPMATTPLQIEAEVRSTEAPGAPTLQIRGQSRVAVTSGFVDKVRLVPADAPACPEAVAAIDDADWVILGPGSWFTSVMPHLLLPGIRQALRRTQARLALTLNLASQPGETAGYSAADHLRSLREYAPDLNVDIVIADPSAIEDLDDVLECAGAVGARVLLRQVGRGGTAAQHDPLRLAAAYRDAFDGILGDVRENSQ
ncbi:MAG: uridine diphosphate-N-acetylglucosamine-binding protein YvcK [Beutenbergiaceae bacterium]